jgi:hypothetical protein
MEIELKCEQSSVLLQRTERALMKYAPNRVASAGMTAMIRPVTPLSTKTRYATVPGWQLGLENGAARVQQLVTLL